MICYLRLSSLLFLSLFLNSISYPPCPQCFHRPCTIRCKDWLGLTLGSNSLMLPRGKQKHLSPVQPWLSLSDKSCGALCQHWSVRHLSPSYTVTLTQLSLSLSCTHVCTQTHIQNPICTHLPSFWQCDRSRWFTPFLPSGLLCSSPRLAHLCRVRAGLSPPASTNENTGDAGISALVSGNLKAYCCFLSSSKETAIEANRRFENQNISSRMSF